MVVDPLCLYWGCHIPLASGWLQFRWLLVPSAANELPPLPPMDFHRFDSCSRGPPGCSSSDPSGDPPARVHLWKVAVSCARGKVSCARLFSSQEVNVPLRMNGFPNPVRIHFHRWVDVSQSRSTI
eukprot:GGOE01008556.1.p2 GENE.GGOE01008556.1~~GGOE01008556.1.p2  ORF type:complete len:125 (+),score=1.65 GGOE01008556.1:388-762(+)